jgi:hypothetical protein
MKSYKTIYEELLEWSEYWSTKQWAGMDEGSKGWQDAAKEIALKLKTARETEGEPK